MPLNKLDNFIKNTEGRILYVNPSDLDSTDSITNQGNSLGRPFKTIQRALIESARFSYQKGIGNDKTDRTTILLFPGDHIVDNRPGWGIYGTGAATLLKPDGTTYTSFENIDLNLETNFDLEQEDNVLYKFNSVYGGVIVPRGTSIIGLDLRKTKIIPKYVPNPTEYLGALDRSAIFRITGNCYFWQFSIFDAKESTTAYTSPTNFTDIAKPTFSHHKLTCFEYADGVNIPKELSTNYTITDLDMYYAKLSNAYGESSGSGTSDRSIDEKWPSEPDGFAKERPEYEIVGAFSADPISITNIISGDGEDSSSVITVTTGSEHGLTAGTPIKIDGVGVPGDVSSDYNISAIVTAVQSKTQFTYSIPAPDPLMPASFASLSGDETVTVETDTVKGASPYIFNISLRSVYGMNGMHADGTKATGFRSMVVAQFTAISLQKDDRAFVKYNKSGRDYDGIEIETQRGAELSGNSASTNPDKVYHLDSEAVYRTGWETAHIKISNNAVMQIVSVFAIGFHHHFECNSGGDASITNSNSNFGQMALVSDGFRPDAFTKDDHAYITSIIPPRAIVTEEKNIDWFALDVPTTATTGISSHLYISGFEGEDNPPPVITQGYKVGAREGDKLYVDFSATTGYGVSFASIQMCDNVISLGSSIASGSTSSVKEVTITGFPSAANGYTFTSSVDHNFNTEEKVLVFSKTGNIPEGLADHILYYVIRISNTTFRLATSATNARNNVVKSCFGGTDITVRSRVSDKFPGEVGSPVQFDPTNNKWFVHTEPNSDIYTAIATLGSVGIGAKTKISSIKRKEDTRSLDEKVYILRVVIPREARNSKNPEDGFVIQESSSTNISITPTTSEFTATTIESGGVHLYDYKRNPRFISTCSVSSNEITAVTDLPHNLNVNDTVVIKGVQSGDNTAAEDNLGYNGKFVVTGVGTNQFTYSTTDVFGVNHSPVTAQIQPFQNNPNTRDISLPRFERKDLQTNLYIYRNEILSDYVEDTQDGVYHIYAVKANNTIETASGEFSTENFGQNVVNLYPENDRDNPNDNPNASVSFAKRSPIGDVVTNDLKKSITREAIDDFITKFEHGKNISGFARDNTAGITTFTLEKDHGFSGLVDVTIGTPGTTYVDGTYYNIKIYNDSARTVWNGATAKVVVASNAISTVDIISPGSAYSAGSYYLEDPKLGYSGGTQAVLTVALSNISDPTNAIVQITGDGSVSDGHYYITSIPGKRQVAVAMTAGDPEFTTDQYLYINEPSTSIATTSISTSETNNIITFNCSAAHGLLAGHRVSILDSNNNKVGSYIVKSKVGINTFTVQTSDPVSTFSVNGGKVLKHALDANEAISEAGNQNFGIRSNSLYAGEIATLTQDIVDESSFTISVASGSIPNRFKLGDYIQIDGEIMRISGAFSSPATITVIRGYFGTQKTSHTNGSRIKKIKPIPVEFRRPSIIRASGHTFEYLGYGPGNYSTGLPQVQVRSLTEREEFLSQSKEKSCGAVVYTGMNNDGDFFIGNKRVTSATGEEKTFDAPVPTVTGEDPSRLSSIFDEITIKERLKVEGGKSKQILSQFDGPVTFNNEVKVIGSNLEINNDTESVDETTGALVVAGGVGIAKSVVINGGIAVNGSSEFAGVKFENNSVSPASGILTVRSNTLGGHGEFPSLTLGGTVLGVTNSIGFNTNTTVTGFLSVTDDITAFWTSDERLKDNINTIEQPLNKVISISGNTFDWNEKSNKTGHDVGLIAQEIEQVLPEAVVTRDNGYLAVDYHKVVPLLVEAIKELSTKVDSLEQKLNDIDK